MKKNKWKMSSVVAGLVVVLVVLLSTNSAEAACVYSATVVECVPAGQSTCLRDVLGGPPGEANKDARNEINGSSCGHNRFTGAPCGGYNPTFVSSNCPKKE